MTLLTFVKERLQLKFFMEKFGDSIKPGLVEEEGHKINFVTLSKGLKDFGTENPLYSKFMDTQPSVSDLTNLKRSHAQILGSKSSLGGLEDYSFVGKERKAQVNNLKNQLKLLYGVAFG